MQKLFSTMYGSKLYGTSTPTSDVDWKHIVLPTLGHLLLAKRVENKVVKTNKIKNTRNGADDVDEEFIPIQVFARDFMNGQTYAIELAFAVDGDHASQTVYGHLFSLFNEELREKFLTSNIKAMMGYVVNQARLYSFKGERLNAVRALFAVIFNADEYYKDDDYTLGDLMDTHHYFTLISKLASEHSKYIRIESYDVGEGRKGCIKLLEKTLPLTDKLLHAMMVIQAQEKKYGSRADAATVQNVDWKATMHAIRIVDEGLNLLAFHKLTFPLPDAEVARLLSMKRGELQLDPIKVELSEKLDRLKDLEMLTTLPPVSPELTAKFEKWLEGWMFKFYNLQRPLL